MDKKSSITAALLGILIVILILIFAIFLYQQLTGVQEDQNKYRCVEICESHNTYYDDNKARLIGNDVCFCIDDDDKIETYVI